MDLIQLNDCSWTYLHQPRAALQSVNLTIRQGEFVGIIGPNGSGKTTLAYTINGLIPGQYHGVKEGEVLVYGKEVETYPRGELQRKVGMVFSDPEAQFTAMTVEDELVFGMENIGLTIPEIRERLDWVLALTDLGPLMSKPPYELSGGQKQRVALAAVLAMTPEVMILDEPTSMLDPISRTRVFNVLEKTKQERNNTVIVIEHSLEKLVPLADRMILLHDGKVVLDDEPRVFFQRMPLLLEKGIEPPGVIRFFHYLIEKGYTAAPLPLTVSEAAERLDRIFDRVLEGGQQ
ncbi:MAG: ATP-binding cassette domain-containing protein [Bellilinea sp.]|jgi:energy-coupling factor transporter ATP-binding protein EcfA2